MTDPRAHQSRWLHLIALVVAAVATVGAAAPQKGRGQQAAAGPLADIQTMERARRRLDLLASGVRHDTAGRVRYLLYQRHYGLARTLAADFRTAHARAMAHPLAAYAPDLALIARVEALTAHGESTGIAEAQPTSPRGLFARAERILVPPAR